jgi:hypothetical protein
MNVMGDYQQPCHQLVSQWREEGVPLHPGATESEFYVLEKMLGQRLPEAFRFLYSMANGMVDMEPDNHFLSLWPLTHICQVFETNVTNRALVSDGKQIAFGDCLIDSYRYLLTFADQYAHVSTEIEPRKRLADSFEDFIKIYLAEPERLYL